MINGGPAKGEVLDAFFDPVVTVSAADLGGCSKSEEEAKADFRKQFVAPCNTREGPDLRAQGLDPERFCACSIGSVMKGRTVAEITKMDTEGGAVAEQVGAKASSECAAQQQSTAGPPPAAAVAEPAKAPAEEETEAEGE